jgi:putative restriction endonuclease
VRELFGAGYVTGASIDVGFTHPDLDLDYMLADARATGFGTVHVRRGQPRFRAALLSAQENHYAITGTAVPSVLEAAHIAPYRGAHTNHVPNGLLLRADVHTLFDLKRLTELPTGTVRLDPVLRSTMYGYLDRGRSGNQ